MRSAESAEVRSQMSDVRDQLSVIGERRAAAFAEATACHGVEIQKPKVEGEAKDQSLFIAGINDLESEGGNGSAGQIRDNVDPNLGEVYQLHHARAHGYGRVEGAAGNGADGECANHHGHTDGQPVERVVRRALGRGDVEHNKSERKSEDKLRYQGCGKIRNLHWCAALAATQDGHQRA